MPAVQRVGDANGAGGVVSGGNPTVKINGRSVALVGDSVSAHPCCGRRGCPPVHCYPVTTTGSPTVDSATRAGKTIYKFTSSGSITVGTAGSCEVLVVGGGGAGGMLTGTTSVMPSTAYAITVGAGGAGTTSSAHGGNGTNSTLSSFTATGGGAGGYSNDAQPGGSGGGGTGYGAQGGGNGTTNTGGGAGGERPFRLLSYSSA